MLDTAAPVGGVPLAVAVLLTTPAFMSASVVVRVAVQVVVCDGASESPSATGVQQDGREPGQRVGHGELRQAHIAGVLHGEGVGHLLPDGGDGGGEAVLVIWMAAAVAGDRAGGRRVDGIPVESVALTAALLTMPSRSMSAWVAV